MTASSAPSNSGIGKYVGIYICILVIAGLQFVVAYQNIDTGQMVTRMFILACVEALLGVLFFMHLLDETRGLLWFVLIFTISVLLGMQYGWSDSFRLQRGVPYASFGK
jgi:heme/copper-type cytochrome/quinol oxidase subunit 4